MYEYIVLDRFYIETEERGVEIAESYFNHNFFDGKDIPNQPARIEIDPLKVNPVNGRLLIDLETVYNKHGRKTVYYIRPDKTSGFVIVFLRVRKTPS